MYTLSDVRDTISKNPSLTVALQDSMAPPLLTVAQRFLAMEVKGTGVKVGNPASTESMSELFSRVLLIDPTLEEDKLSGAALQKATALKNFFEVHSHSSQYAFQLKKCGKSDCNYCIQNPVRLQPEIFHELSVLPLPLFDTTGEHYKKSDEVYGQQPSDKDRPSLSRGPSDEVVATD